MPKTDTPEVDRPDLPEILPIFPLTGVLLLPHGQLPLHVFEPRYCHMVEDALASHRCLGIVQPRVPNPEDARGDEAEDSPEIYSVGCLGRIDQVQELPQDRYVLVLQGVQRFAVVRELELHRGYRRIVPDYSDFAHEISPSRLDQDRLATPGSKEIDRLLDHVERYALRHGIEVETSQLRSVPPVALVHGLAMALPLPPAEKQALLEAPDPRQCCSMLASLLQMDDVNSDGGVVPN